MKIERRDGSDERRVLTAMIVDQEVLGAVVPHWPKTGLFQARWSNIIGEWCVSHYKKYRKAPGRTVEALFDSWAAENADKDTVKLVEKFLVSLNNEYQRLKKDSQSQYVTDLAGRYFTRVRLKDLSDQIQGLVGEGKVEDAAKLVSRFSKLEVGAGRGVNVLEDADAMTQAVSDNREPVVTYPGALGKFFGKSLERDGFVVFMGPEKRGKTQWLIDVAWRAMLLRRKVAFFEVGDMSQDQVMRRFMVRAARHPIEAGTVKYPQRLEPPREEGAPATVTQHKEKKFDKPLSWQAAREACQKIIDHKTKTKTPLLKLSVHPNSSVSVHGVQAVLQDWERDGWVPDVVVIDYADILAAIDGRAETRDQINATWKGLRALSQSLHCLVVTATQSDAASYSVETMGMSNFSEDKRKFSHVTGMVGINQSDDEKRAGVVRLNWLVLREADFSVRKCVHVAGCPALAMPAIVSTF